MGDPSGQGARLAIVDRMKPDRQLLILRHSALDGPGHLEPYFVERGWQVRIVDVLHDGVAGLDATAPDLVLPLGSGLSVYDEALFPFITAEREFLRERIDAGRPLLAICFGAQLTASALGAPVYRAQQPEIGWLPLELTAEGQASPLRQLAADRAGAVMHWHQDTFDLPAGATRLARSALCENQAFAIGRHLLALQFHPEVTTRGVEAWLAEASFTPETRAARVQEIRADSLRWQPAMQAQMQACIDAWIDQWERDA